MYKMCVYVCVEYVWVGSMYLYIVYLCYMCVWCAWCVYTMHMYRCYCPYSLETVSH